MICLFVDINNRNTYPFDLNKDRTQLLLDGPSKDKIVDKPNKLHDVTFAKGCNGIADPAGWTRWILICPLKWDY
jgi:hypothetical protein